MQTESKLESASHRENRLPASALTIRQMDFQFPDLPLNYWGGRAGQTNFINSLHILFPPAERYFVRIFNRAVRELKNPELQSMARGFSGQEMQHSVEHQKLQEQLSSNHRMDDLVRRTEGLFARLESRLPLKWNMALVAAIEHFTALFGNIVLTQKDMFASMHSGMRDLLFWHAAEEIEHKAVAFDVFRGLSSSYLLRVIFVFPAYLAVLGFTVGLMLELSRRQKELWKLAMLQDLWFLLTGKHYLIWRCTGAVLSYCRPGFHPDEVADHYLAGEITGKLRPVRARTIPFVSA
ncbi:MAG: metal-dependent hydrolase [Leptospiraceae bacterium]|nr:metal-dependent hydrolase [Leptospiraceae bacterium]